MGLPDVNVLLYAANGLSPFNAPCAKWLTDALNGNETVSFSWHSLLGFIRISTNPRAMKKAISLTDACAYVDEWLNQPMSRIVEPLNSHPLTLKRLLSIQGSSTHSVGDAHLAALAIDHGVELISCDTDFARYPGLKWFNPVTRARTTTAK